MVYPDVFPFRQFDHGLACDFFGIDTRLVRVKGPKNGGANPLAEDFYRDEWGITRRKTANGYYYDIEVHALPNK